jgi:hypothetical protein
MRHGFETVGLGVEESGLWFGGGIEAAATLIFVADEGERTATDTARLMRDERRRRDVATVGSSTGSAPTTTGIRSSIADAGRLSVEMARTLRGLRWAGVFCCGRSVLPGESEVRGKPVAAGKRIGAGGGRSSPISGEISATGPFGPT